MDELDPARVDPDPGQQHLEHYRHPLLGLQLYTLGNLNYELGRHDLGAKQLTRALRILRVTHGAQAPLVCGLQALLLDARQKASAGP